MTPASAPTPAGASKRRLPLVSRPSSTFVAWRGPSPFDGGPIVLVVTNTDGSSKNPKTGPVAHAWILREDVHPVEAQRSGADASVCGSCRLRPLAWRESGREGFRCYVSMMRGPHAAWASRGLPADLEGCCEAIRRSGVVLRLGAYGEPAALPEHVVAALAGAARGVTAYTHDWREPRSAWLRKYAMASVEDVWSAAAARVAGWRTFRVMPAGAQPVRFEEILCPFEDQGLQCSACRLCNGAREGGDFTVKSIAIHDH